jgi:hypothetical protein
VSALAHYLEDEGLATTIVGLVRLHSEKIKPPRSLWVEFELGRPLGGPHDKKTQRAVLESALALLESDAGPGLLVDYPADGSGTDPDPAWRNPVTVQPRTIDPNDIGGTLTQLLDELAEVEPAYQRRLADTGRTTFGVVGLEMRGVLTYLMSYLAGVPDPSPHPDMAPNLAMRFAADDLKAFYLEAATSGTGKPSSWQLGSWFWRETAAGALLVALRANTKNSDSKSLARIGTVFLVPRIWVDELGL